MSETIQEFVDSRGVAMRIDRDEGVIRGVKVLGLRSRNGRSYLAEALERAVSLYEGAKVNVNHPKADPAAARDYQDRIGNLRNVAVRAGEGLFADFHFNPKHVLAEQLLWDAEHAPENVGFSHNVLGRTSRQGNETVVEAITKVQSVDLVADPATTHGLFEAVDGEETASEQGDAVESLRTRLAAAEAELEQLRESESRARRESLIHRLLAEAGLAEVDGSRAGERRIVTERFLEMLGQAPDDETVRELIRDRAELVESLVSPRGRVETRPEAREQGLVDEPASRDAASFVKAIT